MEQPPKLALVGAGNLAWSLIPALQDARQEVLQLISRNAQRLTEYGQAFGIPHLQQSISGLHPEATICILCVPDGAITACVAQLATLQRPELLVLHVSGTTSLSALSSLGSNIGVLYPLQTFSKGKRIAFDELPLCLEATESSLESLSQLGEALSQRSVWMDSATRLRLHLGAVMVSNFPNVLFRLTEAFLGDQPSADLSLYQPLVQEMVAKAFEIGPAAAQTGPALRQDLGTLHRHLQLLEGDPNLQALYWELSRLIQPALPADWE